MAEVLMKSEKMSSYKIELDSNIKNTVWDRFLEGLPGNKYLQSSLWGEVNSLLGWRVERIIIWDDNQIIGGSQIIYKQHAESSKDAFVLNGPIMKIHDEALLELLFKELIYTARAASVDNLFIQPAYNVSVLRSDLIEYGFRDSEVKMELEATTTLDLSFSLDSIMNKMKSNTRRNIRIGSRRGMKILEGNKNHLPEYYELLKKTSERKNFSPVALDEIMAIWDVFSLHKSAKLFLCLYEEEIIAGQLVLAFGNTLTNKLSVWSGKYSSWKPNEFLYWHTIKWAKENAYLWFDLSGIDPHIAKAVLSFDNERNIANKSYSTFKLGFGGNITLLPGVYEINTSFIRDSYYSKYITIKNPQG